MSLGMAVFGFLLSRELANKPLSLDMLRWGIPLAVVLAMLIARRAETSEIQGCASAKSRLLEITVLGEQLTEARIS